MSSARIEYASPIYLSKKVKRMPTIPTSLARPALEELLKVALKNELTSQEIWDQRVSFIFGNLPFSSKITRAEVKAAAVKVYGPRPLQ